MNFVVMQCAEDGKQEWIIPVSRLSWNDSWIASFETVKTAKLLQTEFGKPDSRSFLAMKIMSWISKNYLGKRMSDYVKYDVVAVRERLLLIIGTFRSSTLSCLCKELVLIVCKLHWKLSSSKRHVDIPSVKYFEHMVVIMNESEDEDNL